jgi:hypothetical protein
MSNFNYKYVMGEISSDEYWAQASNEFDFDEIGENCEEFAQFVKNILDEGFQSLNKLDRDNALWEGTNCLATVYKLKDYGDYLIDKNINPVLGAWLNISVALVHGQQHLELKNWRVLKEHGELKAEWLVYSAWNMSPYWIDLNVNSLSEVITKLDIYDLVKKPLSMLIKSVHAKDLEPKQWVSNIENIVRA